MSNFKGKYFDAKGKNKKNIENKVISYVKENNLEQDGMIAYVKIIEVAKKFDLQEIEVMYIMRYCR